MDYTCGDSDRPSKEAQQFAAQLRNRLGTSLQAFTWMPNHAYHDKNSIPTGFVAKMHNLAPLIPEMLHMEKLGSGIAMVKLRGTIEGEALSDSYFLDRASIVHGQLASEIHEREDAEFARNAYSDRTSGTDSRRADSRPVTAALGSHGAFIGVYKRHVRERGRRTTDYWLAVQVCLSSF